MTINELLVTEIKAKSELAKKAIELYDDNQYVISFTDENSAVKVEISFNFEIKHSEVCANINEIVLFFENKLSIIE
jgi:hypothetical protein